ncbi:MAG: hypothetical protein AAGC92_09655 [Pseudomonadota bacterium]
MRLFVILAAVFGVSDLAQAARGSETCQAHAKLIAAELRAVERYSGAHPLDMGEARFQSVLVSLIDGTTEEKDLARRVILSMQLSLQDGCRNLRKDLEALR